MTEDQLYKYVHVFVIKPFHIDLFLTCNIMAPLSFVLWKAYFIDENRLIQNNIVWGKVPLF
jgi:hypothetical protein